MLIFLMREIKPTDVICGGIKAFTRQRRLFYTGIIGMKTYFLNCRLGMSTSTQNVNITRRKAAVLSFFSDQLSRYNQHVNRL